MSTAQLSDNILIAWDNCYVTIKRVMTSLPQELSKNVVEMEEAARVMESHIFTEDRRLRKLP